MTTNTLALNDQGIGSWVWADVAVLIPQDLCRAEVQFLHAIQHRLWVGADVFETCVMQIERLWDVLLKG